VRFGIVAAALTSAVLVAGAAEVAAQAVTDVLTIGTVSVSSGTGQVEVPIYIQDNTGTPIGRDQGARMRISGFAMQVVYGPNSCIDTPATASQRIDLAGGILASQSADIDSRVKVANTSQSWIYSSAETNGLIPFTAAPLPGDRIGAMVFNLTGCPAGPINLIITTTGGAGATLSSDNSVSETVGNGGLSVTNGAINIATTSTPTSTPTNSLTNTPTPTPSITPTPTRTPTPTNTPVGVAPPVILSVKPAFGTTRGGTTVTLGGDRFQPGARVFFGDTPASSVNFSSVQELIAVTDAHAAGVVEVTVTNPDGGTASVANAYRYTPPGVPRLRPTPRVVPPPT
jgi:IPT/TIG domain-containing protein